MHQIPQYMHILHDNCARESKVYIAYVLYTKIAELLIHARIYMKSKSRYVTLIRAQDDGAGIFLSRRSR